MITTGTCLKCNKIILSQKYKLKCSSWKFVLHCRFSHVNRQQYVNYAWGDLDFICQFCNLYTCLKCSKHVYDKHNSVQCDGCNLWIHQKFAGITKKQYELLQKEGEGEPWYCRPCRKGMFPYFDLTNVQINTLTGSTTENYLTSHHNFILQGKALSVTCSVCLKKISILWNV